VRTWVKRWYEYVDGKGKYEAKSVRFSKKKERFPRRTGSQGLAERTERSQDGA